MTKMMTANFRGTELYGFDLNGIVVVALKPIVTAMGLAWSSQLQRVRRDPVLNEGVFIINIPFGRGGKQQQICLRIDLLHGWLFTVNSTRVKESLREQIQAYQRDCYRILFQAFSPDGERLAQQAQESESLRVRMVAETRQTFGALAAQQLWRKLDLPYVPAMAAALSQSPPQLDFNDLLAQQAA